MRHLILSLILAGCASTASRPASPPPQQQGQLEHGMQNCPNALAGATTRLTNTPGGVDVEITASEPAVQQQIVDLAIAHAHMGRPNPAEAKHTGMHGGPGDIGHCPIVHTATTVTFTRLADGAVFHILAVQPEDALHLQATVANRVAQLAAR